MSFFKSIFNNNSDEPYNGLPENRAVLHLIDSWYRKPGDGTYRQVVEELMNGQPTLLLPTVNNEGNSKEWQTTNAETKINLTSVTDVAGVKTLVAFTDEESLQNWKQVPVSYTALKSNDVLVLCEQNGITNVIINDNSYNMFVLSRSREHVKIQSIPENAKLKIGTAERSLPVRIIEKITAGFKRLLIVEEAYQYASTYNDEPSLVVGVKLTEYTNENKAQATFAVQDALRGEDLEQHVEVFFLEDFNWIKAVRKIPYSKFYNK